MSDNLTDRATELLTVLQANPGRHSRAELAALLNKARLNPHELELLDRMADDGLIERGEEMRGIKSAIVYRAKE